MDQDGPDVFGFLLRNDVTNFWAIPEVYLSLFASFDSWMYLEE